MMSPDTGKHAVAALRKSFFWILAALLVLAADRWIPAAFWEHYYYEGFFTAIRIGYDYTLGWSPVPAFYIVLAIIVVRTFNWLGSWKNGLWRQLVLALGGLSIIVVLFYVLWGFNYHQRSLSKRLGLELAEVGKEEVEMEFSRATVILRSIAENLLAVDTTKSAIRHKKISERRIRENVEDVLAELGLPHHGCVRIRQLWPPGILLRWNTAGIYIPHTCEGHIDRGLLSVQKPFTMAHEMAHGYGVTDEGDCNFIAWLACRTSDDPWMQYSNALTYWRYTAVNMPRDSVESTLETLPPVVHHSIELIHENDDKFPDLLPRWRDAVYSSYLTHHGVHGGLHSYNYVVLMVIQYLEKEKGSAPYK